MKQLIEIVAMTIALVVLVSETDSLSVLIVSKLIAVVIFVGCAYDLNLLTKKKGQ